MRTETDHTENSHEWTPFGPKIEKPTKPVADEWQKSPDAPGVEYNWKTGKTRTNMPVPNAWVEDLAMQAKDEPKKIRPSLFDSVYWGEWNRTKVAEFLKLKEMIDQETRLVIGFDQATKLGDMTGVAKVHYDVSQQEFLFAHFRLADLYK